MKTYGFAIVGCGMISEFHRAAIAEIENARLAAVSDVIEASAQRVGEAAQVPWYTDYNEMVQRDDVDIVTICTPSGIHQEPGVAAARAGKHVIVEKPLEVTLERCDAIIQACEEAGVALGAIFPSRFSEASQAIKQAIGANRFGKLSLGDAYVKWYRSQEYYDSGGWRGTWKMDGGGALMNQSIHAIDLLQWFMGPVSTVQAFADTLAHERIEVEDVAVAALRFANGALGVIEGTTAAYPGMRKKIEISGDQGTAIMEDEDMLCWEFQEEKPEDAALREQLSGTQSSGGGASDPRAISHENHRRQFVDFLDALEEGRTPLVDGHEGRKAVEIILAIYQSASEGKAVSLPL